MIYWRDVRTELVKHCPYDAIRDGWKVSDMVHFLNKTEGLSMQAIAKLTKGKCGRTSLCLMMKRLQTET